MKYWALKHKTSGEYFKRIDQTPLLGEDELEALALLHAYVIQELHQYYSAVQIEIVEVGK